jgi:hypothetical protein
MRNLPYLPYYILIKRRRFAFFRSWKAYSQNGTIEWTKEAVEEIVNRLSKKKKYYFRVVREWVYYPEDDKWIIEDKFPSEVEDKAV